MNERAGWSDPISVASRAPAGSILACGVNESRVAQRQYQRLCYQKMSSARMSRGETLVLVMQPAQDRPTHDLALAPGR